jgi:hypothetical protein
MPHLKDSVSFNDDVTNNKASQFKCDTVSVSTLLRPGGRLVPKSDSSVKFPVLARFEDPYCDLQRISSIFFYFLTSTINDLRICRSDLSSKTIEISSVWRLEWGVGWRSG